MLRTLVLNATKTLCFEEKFILSPTRERERESSYIRTDAPTRVTGSLTNAMEGDTSVLLTETYIKASLQRGRLTEKDSTNGATVRYMMESG